MAKFMIIHHYKGDPAEVYATISNPETLKMLTLRNISPDAPAKSIFTWSPYKYGRTDLFGFCLWEGETIEGVREALGDVLTMMDADIMEVEELDWAQLEKQFAPDKQKA
jgi:hypothetical protein